MKTNRKSNKHLNEEFVMRRNKKPQISRIIYNNDPYIHFHTDDNNNHCFRIYYEYNKSNFTPGFQASLDREEWFDLTKDFWTNYIVIFENDLWIRGKSVKGTDYMIFSFDIDLRFANPEDKINNDYSLSVEGDIRTLIDWMNYDTCDTSNANFSCLFYNCKQIVDASNLKLNVKNLKSSEIYAEMFKNCVNLEKAPRLPAMSLSKNCYREMFFNCCNLEEAPKLPAKLSASDIKDCYSIFYNKMFYGCKKLKYKAPIPIDTANAFKQALQEYSKLPEEKSYKYECLKGDLQRMYEKCPLLQ